MLFRSLSLSRLRVGAAGLIDVLSWLIGLGAVILLWRRDSSSYFGAQAQV